MPFYQKKLNHWKKDFVLFVSRDRFGSGTKEGTIVSKFKIRIQSWGEVKFEMAGQYFGDRPNWIPPKVIQLPYGALFEAMFGSQIFTENVEWQFKIDHHIIRGRYSWFLTSVYWC